MKKNLVSETLDLTNELNQYFESKEEFKEFSDKVLKTFDDLEAQGFSDISFDLAHSYYSDYEDTYSHLRMEFYYNREITLEEEVLLLDKKRVELENKKICEELSDKMSSNSIWSIINNEDLKKMYLDGKIIV